MIIYLIILHIVSNISYFQMIRRYADINCNGYQRSGSTHDRHKYIL